MILTIVLSALDNMLNITNKQKRKKSEKWSGLVYFNAEIDIFIFLHYNNIKKINLMGLRKNDIFDGLLEIFI